MCEGLNEPLNVPPPLLPPDMLAKAQDGHKQEAQDLHAGDVFVFRHKLYVTLSNFTDTRTTQTIITCVAQEDSGIPFRTVTVIRFFRTVKVPVCHHVPLSLNVLHLEQDEISEKAVERLERQRGD